MQRSPSFLSPPLTTPPPPSATRAPSSPLPPHRRRGRRAPSVPPPASGWRAPLLPASPGRPSSLPLLHGTLLLPPLLGPLRGAAAGPRSLLLLSLSRRRRPDLALLRHSLPSAAPAPGPNTPNPRGWREHAARAASCARPWRAAAARGRRKRPSGGRCSQRVLWRETVAAGPACAAAGEAGAQAAAGERDRGGGPAGWRRGSGAAAALQDGD